MTPSHPVPKQLLVHDLILLFLGKSLQHYSVSCDRPECCYYYYLITLYCNGCESIRKVRVNCARCHTDL